MTGGFDEYLTVPAARSDEVVTTASDDELLVYDARTHHIHHLNAVAAIVWRLCDGQRTIGQISAGADRQLAQPISGESVALAVRKLADAGLLTAPVPDYRGSMPSDRRAFLRRSARIGAAAIPAIASITAPRASAAASGLCEMHESGNYVENCMDKYVGLCCRRWAGAFGVCNEADECELF